VGTAEVEKPVPQCYRDLKAGKQAKWYEGVWCMELWMNNVVVITRQFPNLSRALSFTTGHNEQIWSGAFRPWFMDHGHDCYLVL
jgi:hypothetical protein